MIEYLKSLGLPTMKTCFAALLTLLVCAIVNKLLTKTMTKVLNRAKKTDAVLRGLILTATKVLFWVLAVVLIAGVLGIPTASLVAVVSVAGLALSLSLQNILSNLFSGITLVITRPFTADDYVVLGSSEGYVRSVGLFYTVIETPDQRIVDIPNSDVTASAIVNCTHNATRRVDLRYTVSYDDGTEAVRDAILEAAAATPLVLPEPAPQVKIAAFQESAIAYDVFVWCDPKEVKAVTYGMNEQVRKSFEKNGITMTYNHLNVHILP